MELTVLVAVVGLFVAVLLLKSIIELAVRYALFVAVALLVFIERYGPDVAGWFGPAEAAEIAVIAGAAMIGTAIVSRLVLSRNRWRFVLVPAVGVALTALATRVVAG